MSPPPTPEPDAPRRGLLLLILSVTAVAQLTFSAVPPVLPELAAALGVSRGAIGLVHGIVAVPGIFLSAYVGYLTDRFGRRRVVRFSLLLYGAAGSACFFAANFWAILGLRLVQGIGASTLLSIAIVLIGDQYTGYRRRWAMGLNVAALTLAGTLGPILSGAIGAGGTFRPFLLYLLAFPVWAAARHLAEPAQILPPERPFAHLREALTDLRRRRRLADYLGILPLSMTTLGVYLGLTQTVAPLLLDSEFGLGTAQRGLLLAAGAGASSVASVLSGPLGRLLRSAWLLTAGLTLEAAGFALIGLAPNLWLVGLGLAFVGCGYGSVTPLLQSFSTSAGGDAYRGVLVGTWVTGNRVGMFVGPASAAAVAGSIGEGPTYLLGAVVVAMVAGSWVPFRRLAAARLR